METCPRCKHPTDKGEVDYEPESFIMRQITKAPKKGKLVIGKPSPEE